MRADDGRDAPWSAVADSARSQVGAPGVDIAQAWGVARRRHNRRQALLGVHEQLARVPTAGPDPLSRRDYLRLLARAFDCDPELVREGTAAAFLAACGEDPGLKLPANTALCDEQSTFVLGRPAIDPLAGECSGRQQHAQRKTPAEDCRDSHHEEDPE